MNIYELKSTAPSIPPPNFTGSIPAASSTDPRYVFNRAFCTGNF